MLSTETLVRLADSNVRQMHAVWDDIGSDAAEREKTLRAAYEEMKELLESVIDAQDEEASRLEQELADVVGEVHSLESRLEEDGARFTTASDQSLRVQRAAADDRLATLQAMLAQRAEKIQKALSVLRPLQQELGGDFEDEETESAEEGDLSDNRVRSIHEHIAKCEAEIASRRPEVEILAKKVRMLLEVLEIQDEDHTLLDKRVLAESVEELGVHIDMIESLQQRKDDLKSLKYERGQQTKELARSITALWDSLRVPKSQQEAFLSEHNGYGLRTIEGCRRELDKLLKEKKASLKKLHQEAREQLTALWDETKVSEEERRKFLPAFTDTFTDESLVAHEQEIERMQQRADDMRPLLDMVMRCEDIYAKKVEFEESSKDPNRFNIPGRLLEEEKFRKRLTKELPSIEKKLRAQLPMWEGKHGPFMVNGERYLHKLDARFNEAKEAEAAKRRSKNSQHAASSSVAAAAFATPRAKTSTARRESRASTASKGRKPGTTPSGSTSKMGKATAGPTPVSRRKGSGSKASLTPASRTPADTPRSTAKKGPKRKSKEEAVVATPLSVGRASRASSTTTPSLTEKSGLLNLAEL